MLLCKRDPVKVTEFNSFIEGEVHQLREFRV